MCNIPDAILSGLFLFLTVYVFYKFVRILLVNKPGKRALKQFLSLVILLSAIRTAGWMHTFLACEDVTQYTSNPAGIVWDIVGDLPAALFLTAFSVNIRTLAKAYYTVATVTYGGGLTLNMIFLVLCNLGVYSLLIVSVKHEYAKQAYGWTIAAVEFFIACFCLLYASLI